MSGAALPRLAIPPLELRRYIDAQLEEFFDAYQQPAFDRALANLADWYGVPVPKVAWYEYLGGGKHAGYTTEDGAVQLQHPEHWKRAGNANANSRRKWVRTVYHEFAHYLLWANPEPKAEWFEREMVKGLRRKG
jgi:hypothetical protein